MRSASLMSRVKTPAWSPYRVPFARAIASSIVSYGLTVQTVHVIDRERMGADLAASVPFYGGQPTAADTAKIKAPLLIHYGSLDTRINAGWPAYEEALKANRATYTMHMYEGANHGFHNDTTPRYDEAAAKLAWQRTLDFFNKYLRA